MAGLTLLAGASLFMAISQGLIGHPDMNIIGNGSSANTLRWYQDISEPMLPRAWVFSLPMLVYRGPCWHGHSGSHLRLFTSLSGLATLFSPRDVDFHSQATEKEVSMAKPLQG